MVLISGVFNLENEKSVVIDPVLKPKAIIDDLKIFDRRGYIEVTNNITITESAKKDSFGVKTLDSGGGKKAISVTSIDLGGKAISVETATNEPKAEVKVEAPAVVEEKITREQAVELLNVHWKKFESEVNKMTDARKLNFLQIVALEEGVAEKKKEIIEARLNEI